MAENLADSINRRNQLPPTYDRPLRPDGTPIENSSSVGVNLNRQQYQAQRQNNPTENDQRISRGNSAGKVRNTSSTQQFAGNALKGVGRTTSRLGGGAGRVAGGAIGAGVGAIGGLTAGGGGALAGARAGAAKSQQIGGQIGKIAGDKMRRSGMLLKKSGQNLEKTNVSEILEAIGTAGKEGSRMLLNTFWCSVWIDFTLISLLYLNCHLFASKMMPQIVCQFGEDDVIGTWLGGGRLGKITGAVGLDGKIFAETIEIIILVLLDLFVLAIVGLIIFLLFNLYDAYLHPGKALWYIVRTGQWGLLDDLIRAIW